MDDIESNGNGEEDEDQFEQMIIENSILLHSLAALLVQIGRASCRERVFKDV